MLALRARQQAKRLLKKMTGATPRDVLSAWLPAGPNALPPQLIETWDEHSVMVLAPHPDDEALGCGGSLIRHAQAGACIIIVYMTDGRLGSAPKEALDRAAQQALVQVRKTEAQHCVDRLNQFGGQAQALHLDVEDGRLQPNEFLVTKLASLIAQHRPALLYLPFMLDTHEDHWQTNRVACAALGKLPASLFASVRLRCYEVWAPLPANKVVDITALMSAKLELARCHASQMRDVNYLHAITGLNAYRAIALPHQRGSGYAEAFYETSAAAYAHMLQRVEAA